MTHLSHRSSKPAHWVSPRPYTDESLRRHTHGPLQPMEQPGLLMRLLGKIEGN